MLTHLQELKKKDFFLKENNSNLPDYFANEDWHYQLHDEHLPKLNELHWQLHSFNKTYVKHMHNIQYVRNHILWNYLLHLWLKTLNIKLKTWKDTKTF